MDSKFSKRIAIELMQTKYVFYITILFFFISCSNAQQQKEVSFKSKDSLGINVVNFVKKDISKVIDSVSCGLNFIPANNYNTTKSEIEKIRMELSNKYQNITDSIHQKTLLDSTMTIFSNILLNKITPCWYGTPWDFNGHTAKPNQGTIACGYFVSTTLRDMGLNLNRYKLAQQNPESEAKSIAIDVKNVMYFDEESIFKKIDKLNDGLFFIGLDNHVGYLYLYKGKSYFIHSNCIDGKVMIEPAKSSEAFYSANYYIVRFTGHKNLAKKWLTKDPLLIVVK